MGSTQTIPKQLVSEQLDPGQMGSLDLRSAICFINNALLENYTY